jgi:hypothetical protein
MGMRDELLMERRYNSALRIYSGLQLRRPKGATARTLDAWIGASPGTVIAGQQSRFVFASLRVLAARLCQV